MATPGADRETVGNRDQPVVSGMRGRVNGPGSRRIVGDREPFWTGARLRRGESESCLITYWKTSKPGILKISITAPRSGSLRKSGSCCRALTGAEQIFSSAHTPKGGRNGVPREEAA